MSEINHANFIHPPDDVIKEVFSSEVRALWRKQSRQNQELATRLQIIEAFGPVPSCRLLSFDLRIYRAIKAAWDTYLCAAWMTGLLNSNMNCDLLKRLRDSDEANFRGAMSECLACWFLGAKLHLPIIPVRKGRNKKNIDFGVNINGQVVGVEVKSPYRERRTGSWNGGDEGIVTQCIKKANSQFANDAPNLLVLVPFLRTSMISNRYQLVAAAYGEQGVAFRIDTTTGRAIEDPQSSFFPNGQFFKTPEVRWFTWESAH